MSPIALRYALLYAEAREAAPDDAAVRAALVAFEARLLSLVPAAPVDAVRAAPTDDAAVEALAAALSAADVAADEPLRARADELRAALAGELPPMLPPPAPAAPPTDAYEPESAAPETWEESPRETMAEPDVEESPAPSPTTFAPPQTYRTGPPAPPAVKDGVVYRVWFGTNRLRKGDGFGKGLGEATTYGHCDVFIPERREIGSLGSPWYRRLLRWSDDRLKLRETRILAEDDFWREVAALAATFDAGERSALLFLHGYNVSFEGAALRTAQLGFDLGVKGPVAFYGWPSRGNMTGYTLDGASIEASEDEITAFLTAFAARCGCERVNVIAHSMGNRGLLRAAQRIVARADAASPVSFQHLVLAAPDVTRGLFLDLADRYQRLARRTTLYVSDLDRALAASHLLQGDRVGFVPPYTIHPAVDTIYGAKVHETMLGHSEFAEARPLLEDIRKLFDLDAEPRARGLVEIRHTDGRYWEVPAPEPAER